jgi:hypothetical protein
MPGKKSRDMNDQGSFAGSTQNEISDTYDRCIQFVLSEKTIPVKPAAIRHEATIEGGERSAQKE